MAEKGSVMTQNERRKIIREHIDKYGEATIAELTELCGDCSSMTLWRDIKQFEGDGSVMRTRGGIVAVNRIQPKNEGLYSARAMINRTAKREIAKKALELISQETSIFMDSGSTVMALAEILPNKHYVIMTSGANIAIELSQRSLCEVTCIGGLISANTLSFSGPQAESFLDGVNLNVALVAASGYARESGFTCGSYAEAQLKKKVIQKASKVIMLMDTSKIGSVFPFTFAAVKDVDVLVTEGINKDIFDDMDDCRNEIY